MASNPFLLNEPDLPRNVDTERLYNSWFLVADKGLPLLEPPVFATAASMRAACRFLRQTCRGLPWTLVFAQARHQGRKKRTSR